MLKKVLVVIVVIKQSQSSTLANNCYAQHTVTGIQLLRTFVELSISGRHIKLLLNTPSKHFNMAPNTS